MALVAVASGAHQHWNPISLHLSPRLRLNLPINGYFRNGKPLLEQMKVFWNIVGTKPSVYGAIFSNFQA